MPGELKKEVEKKVRGVKQEVKKVEEKIIPNFLQIGETKSKNLLDPEMFKAIFHTKNRLTFGQRAADGLTKWAGSWIFIGLLFLFIAAWIYLNITAYVNQWDPWPFIILNLCLSCLAAIQAPIILMSQNREGQRDRLRQEYDYAVNRKAEKEIRDIQKDLEEIKGLLRKKR